MTVAMTGATTEATTTIGTERRSNRMRVAAERRRLVGTVMTAITGRRRLTTAERAIAGGTVAMATTGRRRRAASASESGRRAGMATVATAETAESSARPTAATVVDGTRSSLLAAARPGALPSCGQGHATSTSGGVRLWWMLLEVEAAPRAGPYDRPRGQGQAGPSCSIDAPLLTARLKQASSVDALLRLHQPGLGRLLRLTEARVSACDARNFSNIAHGVAKSRVAGARELFAAVAEAAVPRLREFEPQNLANTAWAYAKAGHAAPALLEAIAAAAVPRLHDFTTQALANTVWAYAKAGHAAPALLEAIAAAAVPRLRDFDPQELANTVWAYATAGHSAPALLDAIAAAVVPRLRDFDPQNLANTAWAYAKAGHAAP
eukprot:gene1605-160_t